MAIRILHGIRPIEQLWNGTIQGTFSEVWRNSKKRFSRCYWWRPGWSQKYSGILLSPSSYLANGSGELTIVDYWGIGYWIECDIHQRKPILTFVLLWSVLVFSGGYKIILNDSCITFDNWTQRLGISHLCILWENLYKHKKIFELDLSPTFENI